MTLYIGPDRGNGCRPNHVAIGPLPRTGPRNHTLILPAATDNFIILFAGAGLLVLRLDCMERPLASYIDICVSITPWTMVASTALFIYLIGPLRACGLVNFPANERDDGVMLRWQLSVSCYWLPFIRTTTAHTRCNLTQSWLIKHSTWRQIITDLDYSWWRNN
ncbi:hypothetical protein DFH29DRAFT_258922 [Suillus ampliporus]|nr:hypothetical protein DFH29DRAFT_258922 [Suillus ampliporus]